MIRTPSLTIRNASTDLGKPAGGCGAGRTWTCEPTDHESATSVLVRTLNPWLTCGNAA